MYFLFCGVRRLSVKWMFFIKVRFFATKNGGSTGPTALESDEPYFENFWTMTQTPACPLHFEIGGTCTPCFSIWGYKPIFGGTHLVQWRHMCKPKPVKANKMISFIACFSYNHTHVQLNPIVFHQNIGPSPSASAIRLPCTNSLGIFHSHFPRVGLLWWHLRGFIMIFCASPSILGCLATDAFSCLICFGTVAFFSIWSSAIPRFVRFSL